jgi:hypothetical protein
VEHPDNNAADLVILNDISWCLLIDISKLASYTSASSLIVGLEGIKDLSHQETLPFTHSCLASKTDEEPQDIFSDIGDEILQAALARTVAPSVCGISGLPREWFSSKPSKT